MDIQPVNSASSLATDRATRSATPSSETSVTEFQRRMRISTPVDRRKGQQPPAGNVTLPFMPSDLSKISFVMPGTRSGGALPQCFTSSGGPEDQSARQLGVEPAVARGMNDFVTGVLNRSLGSLPVHQAEERQVPNESNDKFKETVRQLRPGEGMEFKRRWKMTAGVPFYGIPKGLGALTRHSDKAPGVDTAWLSPRLSYEQGNSTKVSRDARGQLIVNVTRSHSGSGGVEVGSFPFWTDNSYSPDTPKATSSAYGFVYAGVGPDVAATRVTSFQFEISADKESQVIDSLAEGVTDLTILVDASRNVQLTTNDNDNDLEDGQDRKEVVQTTTTTPFRFSLGGNIGGGVGISSPKTIPVSNNYQLDTWLWPNVNGSASIEAAEVVKTESSAGSSQTTGYFPGGVHLEGGFNTSVVLGHHVPKPDKELFEDDFWILQYPLTIDVGASVSMPVIASKEETPDGNTGSFEVTLSHVSLDHLAGELRKAGIENAAGIVQEMKQEIIGDDKAVRLIYVANSQPEGQTAEALGEALSDVSNYRLSELVVTESIESSSMPLGITAATNFDLTFLSKEDEGTVATSRLSSVITLKDGTVEIAMPGGAVTRFENASEAVEEGMSFDAFETGLRRRSGASADGRARVGLHDR